MSGNKLASRKWVEEQMAVSGVSTAAEVKTAYESNANTNAFTDAQKAKVNAIVEVYPTADKNLLTLIKGAAKGDIFVSDGDGSLTKIPVPEVASTFKHSGEADSIPFWSSDEAQDMINAGVVSKMENSRDKQLMEILAESGKPYVKKHDGYAVKVEEDKQITYTDYDNTELTLTIPKGSYLMVAEDSCYPKIVTEKEWDDSNKFIDGEKSTGKDEPRIGLESMMKM